MGQSAFGAGFLWGTPVGGSPVMFGALQDVSMDVSFDQKMLYGQGSVALEQARGKAKIDFKATFGRIDPILFNSLFWGQASAVGQVLVALGEAGTIPSASAYTVTAANAANFRTNLSVFNATTGRFMAQVTSGPTTGQYSVAAGVYTFAAADQGQSVKLYYSYGSASLGSTLTITNPIMDAGPIFSVDLCQQFRSKQNVVHAFACQAFKLSFPLKQDDFTLPALDFSAQDDGMGNVLTQSVLGY